ncbi:hypothetical protein CYY_005966 [Polysphondylium violaceum]|uniref:U-box domain-containing protein n=1 Tax=Polysphondylium violaceum TaxID=133409 RepID=A0A8J4PTF2_9MYCE|nr:hypothetical protein CYY_005966 [Polysphondylium violaceum]
MYFGNSNMSHGNNQYHQQQQQQINNIPLVNFANHQLGAKIYCDGLAFSEEYPIESLLQPELVQSHGYLASSFVKTPLDITISLPYPIDLERIGINSKVKTCVSQSISFYVSELTMDEINIKSNSNNGNINMMDIVGNSSRSIPPFKPQPQQLQPQSSMLSVGKTDLSKERYPSNSPNKIAQQKYSHQQFKIVGSVDNLHLHDHLVKYVCNSDFKSSPIPNQLESKIRNPNEQIKFFHSNKNLLVNVKSIRIRILKVFQSSCPALGAIEIWGIPSRLNSMETVEKIYTINSNCQQQQLQQQIQQHNVQLNNNNSLFGNNSLLSNFVNSNSSNSSSNNNSNNNSHVKNNGLNIPSLPIVIDVDSDMDMDMGSAKSHNNSNQNNLNHFKSDNPLSQSISEFSIETFLKDHPEITTNEAGIPSMFLDPITLEMMTDPVILPSGNVVNRTTIEKHFQNSFFTDPFTGIRMRLTEIQTHHVLWNQIQAFLNEKKKRKRLLKSNSQILKNQIQMNMQPQIGSPLDSLPPAQAIFELDESHSSLSLSSSSCSSLSTEGFQGLNISGNDLHTANHLYQFQQQQQNQHFPFGSPPNDHHHQQHHHYQQHHQYHQHQQQQKLFVNIENNGIVLPSSTTPTTTTTTTTATTNSSTINLSDSGGVHPPGRHPLTKIESQGSFVELPIKKHRR